MTGLHYRERSRRLVAFGGVGLAISPFLPWATIALLGSLDLFQLLRASNSSPAWAWVVVLIGLTLAYFAGRLELRKVRRLGKFAGVILALYMGLILIEANHATSSSGGLASVGIGADAAFLAAVLVLLGGFLRDPALTAAQSREPSSRTPTAVPALVPPPNPAGVSVSAEVPYCTECGAELEAGARFCSSCGASQAPPEPPTASTPPDRAASRETVVAGSESARSTAPPPARQAPPGAAPSPARRWSRGLVGAIVAIAILAGAGVGLVIVLISTNKHQATSTTVAQPNSAGAVSGPGPSSSSSAPPASAPVGAATQPFPQSFQPMDTGRGSSAELPTDSGWLPSQPQNLGSSTHPLLETTDPGPGSALVLVDYTPQDTPNAGSVASAGSGTVAGVGTEEDVLQPGTVPDCTAPFCVDYLQSHGRGGVAVVAGGDSLTYANALAARVISSWVQ